MALLTSAVREMNHAPADADEQPSALGLFECEYLTEILRIVMFLNRLFFDLLSSTSLFFDDQTSD
jgi:hypothetical protein